MQTFPVFSGLAVSLPRCGFCAMQDGACCSTGCGKIHLLQGWFGLGHALLWLPWPNGEAPIPAQLQWIPAVWSRGKAYGMGVWGAGVTPTCMSQHNPCDVMIILSCTS